MARPASSCSGLPASPRRAAAIAAAAAALWSAPIEAAAARLAPTEAAALVALHRTLADGTAGCLNPSVGPADMDDADRWNARRTLRQDGIRHPTRRAIEQAIREDVRGSWGTLALKPLDPATEAQVVEAYAAAAMRAPRSTRPATLVRAQLPPDIVLRADCYARLPRPTISGDWAFVGHLTASAGHLYALRREHGGWRVVAHRFTAIV